LKTPPPVSSGGFFVSPASGTIKMNVAGLVAKSGRKIKSLPGGRLE